MCRRHLPKAPHRHRGSQHVKLGLMDLILNLSVSLILVFLSSELAERQLLSENSKFLNGRI